MDGHVTALALCKDAIALGDDSVLDNKRLVGQFAKDRVDYGPSGVDDACNSAAGAMVLAISRQPMIIFDAALAKLRLPSRAYSMFWQRAFY
jgi:hypothetical protein